MEQIFSLLAKHNSWFEPVNYDLGFLRTDYLKKISQFIGTKLIKILVGQRRSGKSYIMRQVIDYLKSKLKIPAKNIIYINKEIYELNLIRTDKDLYQIIEYYLQRISPQGRVYLFIDEVQTIENWQKVVTSLASDPNKDFEIFLSGSNSTLLSGELATLLSGRYVTIEVFPYSYKEFLQLQNQENTKQNFLKYMSGSAMPETFNLPSDEAKYFYFQALKDTILFRDIIMRHKIRDTQLLEEIFLFLLNNIGNLISTASIVKYYKSRGKTTDYVTVSNYISYLQQAFIIQRADRQHVKTKEILGNQRKFYLTDLGFRNVLYPSTISQWNSALENIVFLELKRRNYQIYVGQYRDFEIDFIATKKDKKIYIQVAYSVSDKTALQRELRPFKTIPDYYPRILITTDDLVLQGLEGVKHYQAWQWLTEEW